uniref:Uncharacterized protein n=1 Tax=Anguilla anguilla TaxID=7936 RepID=A0A0E9S394_ANGAN
MKLSFHVLVVEKKKNTLIISACRSVVSKVVTEAHVFGVFSKFTEV